MGIWFIWRPSLDDILEDFGVHLYSNILYKQMIEIHISIITKFPIIHSGTAFSRLVSFVFIHVWTYFNYLLKMEFLDKGPFKAIWLYSFPSHNHLF